MSFYTSGAQGVAQICPICKICRPRGVFVPPGCAARRRPLSQPTRQPAGRRAISLAGPAAGQAASQAAGQSSHPLINKLRGVGGASHIEHWTCGGLNLGHGGASFATGMREVWTGMCEFCAVMRQVWDQDARLYAKGQTFAKHKPTTFDQAAPSFVPGCTSFGRGCAQFWTRMREFWTRPHPVLDQDARLSPERETFAKK